MHRYFMGLLGDYKLNMVHTVIILLLGGMVCWDTGSEVPLSCPLRCDLLQEIQTLRQLVNQESILRMGIDTQIQDLRKTVTETLIELRQNGQLLNASLEDTKATVQRLEKDTDTRINYANSSVQMTQAMQNGQMDIIGMFMGLENKFASLNQTFQSQGKLHFITQINT